MIPRVFISSTYYDLKHVRERMEKFISNYGFEPVLFESDKITYQHGKEIDHSAYFEVGLCHIMILIVGGRYGSPSSILDLDEVREKYDEDYISITQREFETATKKNIPIIIFIDKNVYGEFQTYKENQVYLDELYNTDGKEIKAFRFAHVDHINVFKFIDSIKTKPIKSFEKIEEIEGYIKSQFSGMFYLYLESLKKKSDEQKILDSVAELNSITLRMNEMLTSVGKEVLGKDKKEYEKVIENQLLIMIDFFGEQFRSSIEFVYSFSPEALDAMDLETASKIIYDYSLKVRIDSEPGFSFSEFQKIRKVKINEIANLLQIKFFDIDADLKIARFDFRQLNRIFQEKVLPFIKNENHESLVLNEIKNELREILEEPPF